MVGTSQKWPAKAGGRSPKGPAVAGTTVTIRRQHTLITIRLNPLGGATRLGAAMAVKRLTTSKPPASQVRCEIITRISCCTRFENGALTYIQVVW